MPKKKKDKVVAPSGPPPTPFPQPQPEPCIEQPPEKPAAPTREEFEEWKNGPEGQGHAAGRD